VIKIIKQFGELLDKNQIINIIQILILTVIGAFMEVLSVSLVLPIVIAVMEPSFIQTNVIVRRVCEIFNITESKYFIIFCIFALIFIYILKNLFLSFESYFNSKFVYKNRFITKTNMLHNMLNKPYEYFLFTSTQDVIRIVNDDVNLSYSLLLTLVSLISEFIVSVFLFIAIFVIDPFMTVFVAVILAVMVLSINKYVKPIMNEKGDQYWKENVNSYKWLLQSVSGIKELKITDNEDFFEDNYYEAEIKIIDSQWKRDVWSDIPKNLVEVGCVGSALLITAIMVYMGRDPEELIASLSAFAMAAIKLMPATNRITYSLNHINYEGPALERLLDSIKDNGNINEDCNMENTASISFNEKIELKDIYYHYPKTNNPILSGANMIIPKHKSVGVIGKSGVGKTTTIDILLGLLNPSSGVVLVDGINIHSDYEKWLSMIGYIPQSIFMMDGTIKENVCFGNKYNEETPK